MGAALALLGAASCAGPADVGDASPGAGPTSAGAPALVCEPGDVALPDPVLTEVAMVDLCFGQSVTSESLIDPGDPDGYDLIHITELARDVERDILWAAGAGGLLSLRRGADGELEVLGHSDAVGRLYSVALLPDGRVAGASRYKGVALYDTSDPTAVTITGFKPLSSPASLTPQGELLHVLTHTGSMITLTTPMTGGPQTVAITTWGGRPWRMALDGDRGYVADALAGVVVLDTSIAESPQVVGTFPELQGVQDVAVGDGVLYASAGAAGLAIYDLADRDAPALAGTYDVGWSVASVEVAGDRLWVTTQEALALLDVSAPAAPQPWGFEVTAEWALDTVAEGDEVWVADWCRVELWDLDPDAAAPALDVDLGAVALNASDPTRVLSVENRGNAPLSLLGVSASDPRVTATLSAEVVEPGASADLELALEPASGPVLGGVCLQTDDPTEPASEIPLTSSPAATAGSALGEPAPELLLFDLQGEAHQLSDHYGQPVLLVWFASW